MEVENVPLSEVIPYGKNPRKNDKAVDVVARSIKEFGFLVPVILDENNVIVAGHTRVKAATKLGLQEIPVIWADELTPEQIKAFRIMDNKSSEYAEWDIELLKQEVSELKALNVDLQTTGLTELELSKLTDDSLEEQPIPEPSKPKYEVKIGDVWALGSHRLMCGDSTNKGHVDKLMNGQKANMVFTDPPYNVDYNTQTLGADRPHRFAPIKGDKQSPEEWKIFCTKIVDILIDNSNGVFYVWHASGPDGRVLATELDTKLHWSATIIWNKGTMVLGRADYQRQYEPIWYGWKEGDNHYKLDDRTITDVWEFSKPNNNNLHPTMKPIQLCKQAIIQSSKTGDIVLDLFGGSGSTCIACEETNRKCFTMEMEPNYCSVVLERWENSTGKKAIKL